MTEPQSSAVFASHVKQLLTDTDHKKDLCLYKTIPLTEYKAWKQQFSWDALYGLRYAQSFCNHFNITDNILYYDTNIDRADKYIKEQYLE